MKDDRLEVLAKFLEIEGVEAQKKMAIEEMSELTKELCKSWREKARKNPAENEQYIREEIADVANMVDILKMIYGVEKIEKIQHEKTERGKKIIADGLAEKNHDAEE
ncbi:MAG: hypothetical protein LBM09_03185 [Candidatus Nomurabacteria bacterium]|jgi:hypothetical protein|nr:hypothetical protein [Candidatus Nomurabacteria bacterium]